MSKRRLSLCGVDEDGEAFRSDVEPESESDCDSLAASMDSEEEEEFLHGIDPVLDIAPQCGTSLNPSKPLPEPSVSADVPHISAGGQDEARDTNSTSPPPAKRRLRMPRSTRCRSSFRSSRGRRLGARASRSSPTPAKTCTTPPSPAESKDRWCYPSEEDEQPPPLSFCPKRTPGVQLDCKVDYSPSEIFKLFFSTEVIRILCRNTNEYAERRSAEGMKRPWKDINADEMYHFISLVIYFGLVKTLSARDLWRKDRLHTHPFPASVIPGYRFDAISAYLYMCDPEEGAINDRLRGRPEYDGLLYLKPLQEQILTACKAYYHPHSNLSIDERMVVSKARISLKQYRKNKPNKWGYELFVLADSTNGYTYNFSVYEGKARKSSGNGLSYDVVTSLLHVPSLGTGYTLYVDNFYTSARLFRHLHKIGFGACGTIRETRIGFPKTTVNALPKNVERGDMRWIRDGPLLFVKWRDTQDVTICSTVHKAYSGHHVERRHRNQNGTRSFQQVPVPDPVKDYNKFMGGVDLSDALMKYYSVTKKTRRWYVKLFLHFIDIAVVNSYIIYKDMALAKQQKPVTQKRFRELLCMELADVGRAQVSIPVKIISQPPSSSLPEKRPQECFPVPVCEPSTDPHLKATRGRQQCGHCKMKTMFKCRSCNVPLCIIVDRLCFTDWHDQRKDLNGKIDLDPSKCGQFCNESQAPKLNCACTALPEQSVKFT